MFNRAIQIKNSFSESSNARLKSSVKNKCITVAFMQKLEYAQSVSGRCVSFRSKSKITSLVIRNKKYGIEIRFMVNNPRFLILV
jgi:hypothetical protein